MTAGEPFAKAGLMAEAIVKGEGLALPIDPMAYARSRGMLVEPQPPGVRGMSGMLLRVGDNFAISYATHIGSEGFENFSVGHELGHYFLPGHPQAVFDAQGRHISHAGYASIDQYELEADRFAASFLMPRHLFFLELQRAGEGLAAVERLASLCKTSLHATAIRYTQCTRDAMAIIVSQGDVIDHCFMSPALREVKGIDWLKKRAALPRDTATFAFNLEPQNILEAQRVEDASHLKTWFGGNRDIAIREDVIGLGRYRKTLTVLHEIDLPDDEDEEDDQRLRESWTPRFR